MTQKNAITVILILLAAIVGVVGYKFAQQHKPHAGTLLPVSGCNPARDDCTVALPDGGEITLSFTPRPIRPLRAFTARLAVHGVEVRSAEIDFDGTSMKMGYYRPRLNPLDGGYSAEAMLPVCVTGTMEWAATILLSTPNGSLAIPFHFEVSGG